MSTELENFKFEKIDSFTIKDLINEPSQEIIDLANKIVKKTENDLHDCSKQQSKFYNDCSKLIFSEHKDNSPILIPAKCGFGKTTFLKSMIVTLIQEINNNNLSEDYLPMIITQERLEDLEKLIDNIKKETALRIGSTSRHRMPQNNQKHRYATHDIHKLISVFCLSLHPLIPSQT